RDGSFVQRHHPVRLRPVVGLTGSCDDLGHQIGRVSHMAGADGAGQPTARTPHFDVVLRGYNQRQVNERVTRLEFDLKNSNRSRDAAAAQVAELSKLLNSMRADLDKTKAQLHNLANSPVSASNVTERVRVM